MQTEQFLIFSKKLFIFQRNCSVCKEFYYHWNYPLALITSFINDTSVVSNLNCTFLIRVVRHHNDVNKLLIVKLLDEKPETKQRIVHKQKISVLQVIVLKKNWIFLLIGVHIYIWMVNQLKNDLMFSRSIVCGVETNNRFIEQFGDKVISMNGPRSGDVKLRGHFL